MNTPLDIQQRIYHQRVQHIIDSYRLTGNDAESDSPETDRFNAYMGDLLHQYPSGLIELALVETLTRSWLNIPMQKGVAFLAAAHECLNQWQSELATETVTLSITPDQFSQITGLDPQVAFTALVHSASSAAANAVTNPTVLPQASRD